MNQNERPSDLDLSNEECFFVEFLTPHPDGDFGVAFAGITRRAGGNDVCQRVASAARDGKHAVLLQDSFGATAVGASSPSVTQRQPLRIREIMR